MREISNYCFLSDDTLLYYRNATDMSLLTDKLNFKCYVWYETKELLTITKIIYVPFVNVFIFIISIVIIVIIIVIIIVMTITVTVITISIIFAHAFFIYLFFAQKLQHSMNQNDLGY